jgi:hypothetical protein
MPTLHAPQLQDFATHLLAAGGASTEEASIVGRSLMPDDQKVFSWSPIDGEAKWLNDTLDAFVLGWLTRRITT